MTVEILTQKAFITLGTDPTEFFNNIIKRENLADFFQGSVS